MKTSVFILLFASIFPLTSTRAQSGWMWSQAHGGASSDIGRIVGTDASGDYYVAGYFSSPSISFGTTSLSTAGDRDVFLVKYDSSGQVLWARQAGGTAADDAQALALDPAGNVYLSGSFASDSIAFGGIVLLNSASGSSDLFLV